MEIARRLLTAASLSLLLTAALPQAHARAAEQIPTAPTFTVFATREGLVGHRTANGHRIRPRDRFVALPSFSALSSLDGHEFQVRVTYRDRSAVLPVWDVGPWNIKDDYWSPDRRYSDLPVGKPMAQAAYEDGYNGGRDEFSRRIRTPNGIDIADGAFWDDLGMTESDWVQVTFLWLGADPLVAVPQPVAEQPLVEANATLVDDGGSGHAALPATWYSEGCGYGGHHAWTYGTRDPARSENRASWSPSLPGPGFYEVLAYIPACGRPATQSARYRIAHDGAASEVLLDQSAQAGTWASLGIYHMGGQPAAVELSDITGDDGRAVRFDAIKWLPRPDTAPPDARVIEAGPYANGSILVRWGGADDVSGIASYDVQVRRLPAASWTDWQLAAVVDAAAFAPGGPGAYAFRARARDWVGHEQPWREQHDLLVEVGN
jgi:hypothetical protein